MSLSMPVVAVVSQKGDIAGMLRKAFEPDGVLVVGTSVEHTEGERLYLEAFLRQHEPDILCFDISPPFEDVWAVLRHLDEAVVGRIAIILTTPTDLRFIKWFESDSKTPEIFEVLGTSDGLEEIVNAVRRAIDSSDGPQAISAARAQGSANARADPTS